MRNQLIIFSKNRASQLHLLLESLEKNSNLLFDDIKVIYTHTDEEYGKGYQKLINVFKYVNFILEDNFSLNTLESIDDDIEYTTFMVDDNVLFKKIGISKDLVLGVIKEDVCCFSLRLGLNCTYSHPANLHYSLNSYKKSENFIRINFRNEKGDFGYPLSVDGHIFKTSFIKNIISNLGNFTNPNVLETRLQFYLGDIPNNVYFLPESHLVGVPANIVNNTHPNRKGITFYFSEKELNDKYLDDINIKLESMNFKDIDGPHKEIKYIFDA